ncbi:SRPBCC family protein [Aquimarina sp. 2304DJ70-9]|uniref:SRPBCC family protein n=1 Tax=Aquimarina penaris TaxID=3231044 RepID=UPI003462977B
MQQISLKKSIQINIPRKELWRITALDFGNVHKWISGVNASEGKGKGINGAPCNERVCQPSYKGFSKTSEQLIEFDPENYRFKYQIVKGMPKMVIRATNTWTHEVKNKGTEIAMEVEMVTKGVMGLLMKGMMKKNMNKILTEALEELKVYAETGDTHPRKKATLAKYKKEKNRI